MAFDWLTEKKISVNNSSDSFNSWSQLLIILLSSNIKDNNHESKDT